MSKLPLFAHFGVGFAGKIFNPRIPTWALLVSALLIDIIAFTTFFFAATWFSHGLIMSIIWTLFGMGITLIVVQRHNSKQKPSGNSKVEFSPTYTALIIGCLIFSHWILDCIGWPMIFYNPESPGVPLFFDQTPAIGLGLYSTWPGAIATEIGVLIIGILIYRKAIQK